MYLIVSRMFWFCLCSNWFTSASASSAGPICCSLSRTRPVSEVLSEVVVASSLEIDCCRLFSSSSN